MKVLLRNQIGQIKECKIGFSWTNLFFGWLTPLVRGDYKNFAIQLVVQLLTFSISVLVFPFFYNKQYINGLLEKGYYPADENTGRILVEKGYLVTNDKNI